MNYSKAILLFLLVLTTGFSQAQETSYLSLKDAVNYALENQADAKKAQLQVENSKYLVQENRAGAYPQISAMGSLGYNPKVMKTAVPSEDFPGGEQNPDPYTFLELGSRWSAMGSVILMQNLFNQAVFTGLKAARSTREMYQINAELTEEDVIERVATAYYNVFLQKEQLKTIDSSYVKLAKSKEVIQNLYDNGLAREIDLDRVKVQLTNLESAQNQLKNAVQLTENALKFYIGMPMSNRIILEEENFEVRPHLLTENLDVEDRALMRALRKREELYVIQKEAKRAEFFPTLSLMAAYSYLGQANVFPIGKGLDQGVSWTDFSMIGLNLQVPIFSGMFNKSKYRQADIELRSLREDIKNAELALDLEYHNAKAQIENSMISIESQRENVELAQKVVDNTENNYKLGLASLTDLLESQSALIEAKNNYTNAILQFKLAEVQLLKSQGELHILK